ncbi:ROK family transcriptional regulator [Actinoplanes sp. CA-030573]|uniref:ROK family transcriptional regulator n=1 Tax=Actinoplanes sp. CA-030573 TaxID=3239898 RepID=UPI003D8C58AA
MPIERTESLAAVLMAIRGRPGVTQPMLTDQVGWGRSVVASRIAELESAGLVTTAGVGPSTGGRAPRQLRLRAESGLVVGVGIGATRMEVGVADLSGRLLARSEEQIEVGDGPETVLGHAEKVVDELLARRAEGRAIWGVGVGVPGPVEFATGLPVAPPIMPGWDGYPIRDRFAGRYGAATWVDNDVNLLALGELHANPAAAAARDFLYVKIGTGIGAGLISGGRLHRGTNGCAGDIGHVAAAETGGVICRCGNAGCLEAAAGGAALAREGRWLAETGGSPLMAAILAEKGTVRAADVTAAAHAGDPAAQALLIRAGQLVGGTLATLVSFYNPALVVLGGEVSRTGDFVIAAIRESVQRRSLPLATRTLRIEHATLNEATGLTGAVHLVVDELFAPHRLARWLPHSTPAGRPALAALNPS